MNAGMINLVNPIDVFLLLSTISPAKLTLGSETQNSQKLKNKLPLPPQSISCRQLLHHLYWWYKAVNIPTRPTFHADSNNKAAIERIWLYKEP